VGSPALPSLKTSLLGVAIAVGTGLLFSYFFGFLVGIVVSIGIGIVFALRSVMTGRSLKSVLFVIGLVSALLLLMFFFGWYGVIAYIVTLLLFYFIRKKKRKADSGVPVP
jgi:hypothetical protein